MKKRVEGLISERTLVLIKPDAVKRGLIGAICQRFENVCLRIVASKMVLPTKTLLDGHFPSSKDWVRGMGEKTLSSFIEYGIDPQEVFGSSDPLLIGERIKNWNYKYLSLGPVFVMVVEGVHAIQMVRKLIGNTLPYRAEVGTIRGDYSINAPDLAGLVGSACKNLVHASSTVEEAEQEISNWFDPSEIVTWQRTDDFLHFLQGEFSEDKQAKEISFMTDSEIEKTIAGLRDADPRTAAEYAYVLAQKHKRAGNDERAEHFANESIALFNRCSMNTLEECATRLVSVGDIVLPSIIHQDVVRDRLAIAA